MARFLDVRLFPARFSVGLAGLFGLVAIVLACIGLFGVVSFSVAQRTREVGIRLSMGAQSQGIVGTLMSRGMRLVLVGGIVGLGLAALASRLLSTFLFGVDPLDPVTFVGVPIVLGAVACLAAYLPAYRASRIDPVRALRGD